MSFRYFLLVCTCLLQVYTSHAQTGSPTFGTCDIGQEEHLFETRHVRAKLLNDGSLFWNRGNHIFHVPKEQSRSPVFTSSLLITGFVGGELRAAATTYNPREYWPGPIPDDGQPPTDCSAFDRYWSVDWETDIPVEDGPVQPSPAVLEWPHVLGAPIDDRNGRPGYQPNEGDLPRMMGDHMTWWTMNDAGGEHERTRTNPLMVDVDVTAFGFDSDQPIGYSLFLRYRVTNRNTLPITNIYLGKFVDADLGDFSDDRLGTDSTLSMLYFYNADNDDDEGSRYGYGLNPPAVGIALIEVDRPGLSFIADATERANSLLAYTSTHFGGGGPQGDPQVAIDFRHQLMGLWKNGSPITQGGWGFEEPYPTGRFFFPGDPVMGAFWSEVNLDGQGEVSWTSDRKGYLSHGPFDLQPGETAAFTIAYVLGRGTDNIDAITALRSAVRAIHNAAPALTAPRGPKPPNFLDGNPPEAPQYPFWVDDPYPNPADDQITLSMSLKWDAPVVMKVVDTLGREWRKEEFSGTPGRVDRELSTTNLPPGTYLIRVSQRGEHVSQTMVVL